MGRSHLSACSQFHVVVIQPIAGVVNMTVPALYIDVGGKPQLVNSLNDYFLKEADKSMQWKRVVSRAVGLFYDYCQAQKKIKLEADEKSVHRRMLRKFAISIAKGTIDTKTHLDELGLYWPASSIQNAKLLISALSQFINWCESEGRIELSVLPRANLFPFNELSTIQFLHQAVKAKGSMFLSHAVTTAEIARNMALKSSTKLINFSNATLNFPPVKEFPVELIAPLLEYGFILDENATIPEDREDLTAKMITLLLLGGGLRKSEPLHLWFNDVVPQFDGSCRVFLRHPSDAETCMLGDVKKLRKTYLAERHMLPRNDPSASKSHHAGWKALKLDRSLTAPVYFFHGAVESLFGQMYLYYLRYRENLMKSGGVDHPFLFVSKSSENSGAPYSIRSYEKAFDRALNRIEIKINNEIPRGRLVGTHPHGLRHFYGKLLKRCGIDQKTIQDCMHHKSAKSQEVYTALDFVEIQKALVDVSSKIEESMIGVISSVTNSFVRG